jgi:MtaA/CmuA family methyltransferase
MKHNHLTKSVQFRALLEGRTDPGKTLFWPILMHFAARQCGHTYGEFASDHRVLVKANLHALEKFDTDMVGLISDPYRETSAFGAPVEFIQEGVPRCKKLLVSNNDDVKALKNPDVLKAERTLDRIQGGALLYKELKGDVPVFGWVEGPLAEACDLAGIDTMLMQLMVDPDFCNQLMDKCLQTAKDFAKAQIDAGCDIIGVGDAICSQISTDMYDMYIKERHKELFEFIRKNGAVVKLHICGNITHLLGSIAETGADIVDLDWEVDLEEAYRIFGPDIIRCGNINPVYIQDSSPENIFETSRKICRQEKGRKFILSGGCEITVNTPVENLLAMRRASGEQ